METTFPRQDARAELFEDYRRRGLWGTRTFDEVLREGCVERWPDHEFLVASMARPAATTYGKLHERGQGIAGALHGLGLRKGDVLAMEMPNWIEGCEVYLGAAALGLVVVPIIHIYKASEVEFILRQSGAKAFVVPDRWTSVEYLPMLEEIRPRLPDLEHVIVVGDEVPDGCLRYEDVASGATREFPRPDLSPDEPHILAYTSGTTAEPKGVVHSHNTLFAECRAIAATSGGDEHDVFLCPSPLGHIAGIYSALISPFLLGYQKLILMDGWDPKWALDLISEHRVTRTGGATFFLMTMITHPEYANTDTSSMELFGVGGANIQSFLLEQAEQLGLFTIRSYGCTEHPSITMGSLTDPSDKRIHTDGRAMADVELRLVDDDGNDVPAGEDGEIVTRGPDQCLGYVDAHLDEEAFDAEGWFHTGDVGRVDDEGYLTITDRKKDIIIRGGENISAREVEEVLVRHPKVLEAAVTFVPDPKYGERVCAFVIFSGKEPPTLEEIVAHFAEQGVAKQKTPERLEIVPEFPRTLAGKVQKHLLRKQLEE